MPEFRPGKPRIHLGLAADIAALATATPITWTNVVSQEGGGWSGATPTVYTVTRTGLWSVVFGLHQRDGSASSEFGLDLLVNGVVVAVHRDNNTSTGRPRGAVLSYLADLNSTDTISAQLFRTAGTGVIEADQTFLQATRVGPEKWTG